jgi:subtilase family serine protease
MFKTMSSKLRSFIHQLSSRISQPSKPQPRRSPLRLEELESRTLLSATGFPHEPHWHHHIHVPEAASSATAHPNVTVQPDAVPGNPLPFTPSQIQQAYGTSAVLRGGTTGSGQTIAIVDAYRDPNISGDLWAFDSTFGLPAAHLSIATPNGVPAANSAWSVEIALDVEWAHVIAPGANILLVEAPSDNLSDLLAAVRYAAAQPGVSVVSMSWGANEFSGENNYDSYFTTPSGHPPVTFVAASGDNGSNGGTQWPAASPNVLTVGGTSLTLTNANAWSSESAWNGGGGGYSNDEGRPAFQSRAQFSSRRTTPDVAYNANPNTGYYVYDSYGEPGWLEVGGTSAGVPQWAGIVALADQWRGARLSTAQVLTTLYSVYNTSAYGSYFHDITSGTNGYYWAHSGYDTTTGLGTPEVNAIVPLLAHTTAS